MSSLRHLPSLAHLLNQPAVVPWFSLYGRPKTLPALRTSLQAARQSYTKTRRIPASEALLECAHTLLQAWTAPSLRPVINATGVILHTNLGRAPLAAAVVEEFRRTATQYSNLEYDLEAGARGKRDVHTSSLLERLTGAGSAGGGEGGSAAKSPGARPATRKPV